jgi:hypothetical protein
MCVAANPEPISNPLVAGRLSIAFAKSASSLSNTGSPSPAGMPRTTHSITPPTESPSSRICPISDSILFAAATSGHRTAFFSASFILTLERLIFATIL